MGRAGAPAAGLGHAILLGARRQQPAVLYVVRRRDHQRVLQLPGPACAGRERRPGRVPLAGRGGRGTRPDLRRPPRRRAAARQRAQGAGNPQGRRRRHLPADDPRGRRGHARLRPDRRAAYRRLRRLRSHRRARAAGGLQGQGADRRGRSPAQGQVHPGQAAGRRGDLGPARPGHGGGGQVRRRRLRDAARPGRVVRRPDRQRRPGLPGRADGGGTPAVPALLLRLYRQAQGNPAHHGWIPHRGHHHHRDGLRPRCRA